MKKMRSIATAVESFSVNNSHQNYLIICYGADGKPDSGIYDLKLFPNKAATVETTNPGDNIIFSMGKFLRFPINGRSER